MSILVRIAKDDYANNVIESKFYNLDHESRNALAPGEICHDCGIETVGGVTPPHCLGCDNCYVADGLQLLQCQIAEVRSDEKNPFLNLLERYAFETGAFCNKSKEYADIYKNIKNVSLKFNRYCVAMKKGETAELPSKEEFNVFLIDTKSIKDVTSSNLDYCTKKHLINKNEQCNIRENLERANVLLNAYRKLMKEELTKAEPEVSNDDMEVGG